MSRAREKESMTNKEGVYLYEKESMTNRENVYLYTDIPYVHTFTCAYLPIDLHNN